MLYQLSYASLVVERETGIEPATNRLEICDSTIELLPQMLSRWPSLRSDSTIQIYHIGVHQTGHEKRWPVPPALAAEDAVGGVELDLGGRLL